MNKKTVTIRADISAAMAEAKALRETYRNNPEDRERILARVKSLIVIERPEGEA